ncbi:MAG TPA: glycerate kinase [Actinobacteria bacterium]|nr:glycerate kinase [Actinomycetota bacterium]
MRVVVAPDKFKGTLTAVQAARAIADGWLRAFPRAEVDLVPMADGGEGTLDTLVDALGGERFTERVSGPLGDPVDAVWASVRAEGGATAVVEMASASGLALLAPVRRAPLRTATYGTGQLIEAAAASGLRRLLVCIGGSASNDGGAGMAQAVGVRLLDAQGRDLAPGGAALLELALIDLSGLDRRVAAMRVIVATDVDNPLTGPNGAAAVYGPQKGASPEDVALLDRALGHFAAVIHRDLGVDVRNEPGAGAAGGLGAGLIAFLGAHMRPGVEVVMEAVGLRKRLQGADVVVTGEGSFDEQSLRGKTPAGVLRAAEELRVPAIVVCGQRSADAPGVFVASLSERFGPSRAREEASSCLRQLTEEVAREWWAGAEGGGARGGRD